MCVGEGSGMPSRFLSNGLHDSFAVASSLLNPVNAIFEIGSLPPATAMSAMPVLIRSNA